jgi:hypothetical protein
MGFGYTNKIKVRGHRHHLPAIGKEWIEIIYAQVPGAEEGLRIANDFNRNNYEQSTDDKFVDFGNVSLEITEKNDDWGYVEWWHDTHNPWLDEITLWWGEGYEGIHINNQFDWRGNIYQLSRNHNAAIFHIRTEGEAWGSYVYSEEYICRGIPIYSTDEVSNYLDHWPIHISQE